MSKLEDLDRKRNRLLNRIKRIIKLEPKISDLDLVIILFLAYLLSDRDELSSRGYTARLNEINKDDFNESHSYYYHYLFSRYFLERIKRKIDSIEYAKRKYKLAIKHLINLNDYSTPINLLGIIAVKAVSKNELDFMETIISEAHRLAGQKRTLVLAEILGQVSLELAKLGLFKISYKYLSQAVKILTKLGYQPDVIRLQSRHILIQISKHDVDLIYEIPQLKYEFQTLIELLKLLSRDASNYSRKVRKIVFKLVLESLSRDYWSKRDYFLENLVKTYHIYDEEDINHLNELAKKFNDGELSNLINIIRIINSKSVSKESLFRLIQLSYNLYKSGKYKLASDILISMVLGDNYNNLDFEEIKILMEVIAFYLETQGLYEEIYYLFGEIARREISRLRIDNSIYFLRSPSKYRSTSQLLRLKLLFEPVIRTAIRTYSYVPEKLYSELNKIFETSNYFLIGYLYSIIAEEYLNLGSMENAIIFINKMLNYSIPSPYFFSIIKKLLLKGFYDYVSYLLRKILHFEMSNDELIIEIIKLAFEEIGTNIGERILSEFTGNISRERLGKLLADLSITLLETHRLEIHSINYLIKAIELLEPSKGHLTILYTIARFAARCDKIESIIILTKKLLNYIEKRIGDK